MDSEQVTIINLFKSQSCERWDCFFKVYKSKIYGFCLSFFRGNSDQASDAFQEVLLKLLRCEERLSKLDCLNYYVFRVVKSCCIDLYRKSLSVNAREKQFDCEEEGLSPLENAEERIDKDNFNLHLLKCLELLDKVEKKLILTYFETETSLELLGKILRLSSPYYRFKQGLEQLTRCMRRRIQCSI